MNKMTRTTKHQSPEEAQPTASEPRAAALFQAEHDTAGFQKKAAKLDREERQAEADGKQSTNRETQAEGVARLKKAHAKSTDDANPA